METTERIVEAYVRYVKGWATIPNIRCDGQFEIDLLAIDPVSTERYHIESGVSVSGSYSKLTARPFSTDDLKVRVKQAGQRRTLDFFVERKFGNPNVVRTLRKFGFKKDNYKKVIVSWGWDDSVVPRAAEAGITLWDFREILQDIASAFDRDRTYFTDDILRTLHHFALANGYKRTEN
jgi:hypothetical protein